MGTIQGMKSALDADIDVQTVRFPLLMRPDYQKSTTDVAAKFGIPRLVFHGTSFFALSAAECVRVNEPYKKVASDSEPFVVPNLPDAITMTREQLPDFMRQEIKSPFTELLKACKDSELKSYGVIANSFYELEAAYADFYTQVLGSRAWHIGPVSLCNKGIEDKARKMLRKGLIIRGWAPQVLILDHQAIGGFVTHCGWNSTLEGIAVGKPMVTWPLFAEQFYNEKLVTQVLKIGVAVGATTWDRVHANDVKSEAIGRSITRIMAGDEAEEIRNRARNLGELAKRAVEEGGSSYSHFNDFIQQLIKLRP
ncbi:hypothetical protein Tsubulata_033070 [Turnera subulata]|uniref:anthocyanidin 3-O-glucosyltransferase n=1 Tax=Turnera subulata TaxID=218843 RepID=A0A9Q0G328_9ROSI|nr:hypothetical protein Tsubulata_033070 [Turnera subulata]